MLFSLLQMLQAEVHSTNVERGMAPLSRDLSGVVLPHDHFGSHLNAQGQTVDEKLEERNFAHAGKVLADIWTSTVTDGFLQLQNILIPRKMILQKSPESSEWCAKHIQESRHFL